MTSLTFEMRKTRPERAPMCQPAAVDSAGSRRGAGSREQPPLPSSALSVVPVPTPKPSAATTGSRPLPHEPEQPAGRQRQDPGHPWVPGQTARQSRRRGPHSCEPCVSEVQAGGAVPGDSAWRPRARPAGSLLPPATPTWLWGGRGPAPSLPAWQREARALGSVTRAGGHWDRGTRPRLPPRGQATEPGHPEASPPM